MELAECGAFRDDAIVPRIPLRSIRATKLGYFSPMWLTLNINPHQESARAFLPITTFARP